jgi:hypothetical protein
MKTTRSEKNQPLFFWLSTVSLASALALTYLNIYLGRQTNYLNYLQVFNTITISILICAGLAITLGLVGLWKVRLKSIPLALISLTSSAFLILLFLID